MTHDVLAISVSTVVSESIFSVRDLVLDSFCIYLSPLTVEVSICTKDWLQSSTNLIDMEEYLSDINKIEGNGLKFFLYYFTCISFVYFGLLLIY